MITYLECPCCGDDGAKSDDDGLFREDGKPLLCGCGGGVCVDEGAAFVSSCEDGCKGCAP